MTRPHDDTNTFLQPREIVEIANRLGRIRDHATELGGYVTDLYFHAHDRGSSSDGPKVTSSVEGYDQLAARRHALKLWRDLQDGIRAEETMLRAWLSRLQRILGEGEPVDSRFRPGRPVTDAELEEAQRQQSKRQARGDFTPVRNYPQPGPVRR